jgi:signal transduction histidine kinase
MVVTGRRKSIAFFIALGTIVVALTVAQTVGWVILNWRTGVLLVLGVLFFLVIIAGVVLNTIFLVREIRRNEQHDAFINAMTHELKTPVASMRLYLETLQTRDVEDGKRREFYDIMLADNSRLMTTIEQVLRAGAAGKSKRLLYQAPVDFAGVVRECLELVRTRHHLPAEALTYSEQLIDRKPTVIGDPDELKAAVSNLLDNAIKYSGPNVRVDVELAQVAGGHLAVRVKDYGVGIAENELKRIFKRFYRIPGIVASKVKGTGLGLFIVRSVAERHGGRAFAESEGAGRGATFTLQIPCAPLQ